MLFLLTSMYNKKVFETIRNKFCFIWKIWNDITYLGEICNILCKLS